MPTLKPISPAVAALSNACEPLFDLIDTNPALAPLGERLILALLHEAELADFGTLLLVRRLRARLERSKCLAPDPAPPATPRGPRNG